MAEWRDAMAKRSDVTKLMAMNGNDKVWRISVMLRSDFAK